MKKALNILTVLFVTLLISCGGKEEKKKEGFSYDKKTTTEKITAKVEKVPASKKIDFKEGNISIKTIDYYYTNPIARSSKVMSECRQISKRFLSTGIEKAN